MASSRSLVLARQVDRAVVEQHRLQHGQQRYAARVQGVEADPSGRRDQLQGRVDEAEVPAGVSVLILHAGGEKGAALAVERLDQKLDAAVEVDAAVAAGDQDARRRDEGIIAHDAISMMLRAGLGAARARMLFRLTG